MLNEFEPIASGTSGLIMQWTPKLMELPPEVITSRRNSQNRTIKQILGHLIDSASNNTHRVIHLQYQPSPSHYPNYASNGNNDRWIAIQNYQEEDWDNMLNLWKYSNLHWIHVVGNINPERLDNKWLYSDTKLITLREMVIDYLRHLELHLGEIEALMERSEKLSS